MRSAVEIAVAHRFGGNQAREGNAVALVFLLAVQEEEGLVLADRTAKGAAELIEIEFFRGRGKEAARIEVGVAQELVIGEP